MKNSELNVAINQIPKYVAMFEIVSLPCFLQGSTWIRKGMEATSTDGEIFMVRGHKLSMRPEHVKFMKHRIADPWEIC